MSKKPKLGQNFLVDDNACLRIADALGDISQRTIVEIGPGHGAITKLLAPRCARLHLIEFDPALARELTFHFRDMPHVTVHNADILKTDLAPLRTEGESLDVVGNLPYYITSDILLHLFAAARNNIVRRAVVMMQREVADRIASPPGHSEYGALSAFTQLHASVANLFVLPPAAFDPPPDVHSTVLRLEFAPRFAELGVDAETFNKFLRAGFAQKRKTLTNNLRNAAYSNAQLDAAWPESLSKTIRAEAATLEQMGELFLALESRK
ncbi:MAG: 16S rRNA (adenine(1518)-N(6)/adenine(1519)-N(6))-dimethyltransferase RsmA [Acidobacteriaceae bacterium]|nr:16S rRNA (adenine(1518)-N(6)/adenine(1519)-N(6))-dimethyltransferase RsmA [Acidobacteriaceae bacterium]